MVPNIGLNLSPRFSAILGYGDGAFFADCDRPIPISELYLLKVVGGRAADYRPRLPAIFRVHDCALPTDRPCLVWRGELNPGQIILGAAFQQSPVVSTVLCECDEPDVSDRHAAFVVYEVDAVDGVSDVSVDQWDAAVLTCPFGTTVCRVEDRAIGPNEPALILADEEDPLVIIDHPVPFTRVAVTLLPPCFTTVFCEENPIVCTDSPASAFALEPDTTERELADVFVSFPRFTTVLRVQNIGILSDDPPHIGVCKVDIPEHC